MTRPCLIPLDNVHTCVALYKNIMHTMSLPAEDRVQGMKGVIAQLPDMNKFVLQHMVAFLCMVISHEEQNKMGKKNISIVFGPNFIKPPGEVMVRPEFGCVLSNSVVSLFG
jgi:RhoGAP domain